MPSLVLTLSPTSTKISKLIKRGVGQQRKNALRYVLLVYGVGQQRTLRGQSVRQAKLALDRRWKSSTRKELTTRRGSESWAVARKGNG